MTAKPKCPACKVEGKEHIQTLPSEQKASGGLARFEIVFCGECGHIISIFPNLMIQT